MLKRVVLKRKQNYNDGIHIPCNFQRKIIQERLAPINSACALCGSFYSLFWIHQINNSITLPTQASSSYSVYNIC